VKILVDSHLGSLGVVIRRQLNPKEDLLWLQGTENWKIDLGNMIL